MSLLTSSKHPPPHSYNTYGNAIQLQDMTHSSSSTNNNKHINGTSYPNPNSSSDSEDSEDEIQFTKKISTRYKIVASTQQPNNRTSQDEGYPIEELPPLSVQVTISDVLFNVIVCTVVCVNFVVDFWLVFYHYQVGDMWASGLTALCVCSGGMALLRQFWGVTYDQLDRIYTRGKCVRIWVNCFPWLATVITSFQTTTSACMSRSNPMTIQRYVKLQELSQSFLLVQGFAQGAPQTVLQLVVLLEGMEDIGGLKATLLLTSIASSLTIMMVSNLPLKSDYAAANAPKSAAYNPYTRLFIGLRMVSSFGSRTLSLSILFSTSRCITPHIISSPSLLISHGIPLSVLLIPRILFTIIDYVHTKIVSSRHRTRISESNELEAISPVKKSRLSDIFIGYLATVFILFSDPFWVFCYGSVESVVFVGFGVVGEVVSGGGCLGVGVGVGLLVVFVLMFFAVPCVVPVVTYKVKEGRRRRRGRGVRGDFSGG